MCGIVGYIGKEKCIPKILKGLSTLEYRGYDSAGIAYVEKKEIKIIKEKGRIKNLEEKIDINTDSYLGIGHTRWATHGEPNQTNAHPHKQGKFTIVHNGIIENYIELKKLLLENGYNFVSETDTEVACALLDYQYKKEKDILKTIKEASKMMRGSFALGILCEDTPDTLYTTRKTSPLIIASMENGNFIASDVPAILEFTNQYHLLDDYEIAVLNKDKVTIYSSELKEIKKELCIFEGNLESSQKNGYEHFMLKEIHEQDIVIKNTFDSYFDGTFASLKQNLPDLTKFKKIDIVACGSAYHAGFIGKTLIENYANIPVSIDVASEYRYKRSFYDKNTLVILVSQSGETADTLAALKKAKEDGITTLAIVNVVGSNIAREADYVVYTKAGCEIAVATTKAYLSQLAVFSLITLYLGYINNCLNDNDLKEIHEEMNNLPDLIRKAIDNSTPSLVAEKIYKHQDIFFIGRGLDYSIGLEGSLKLKEISYINCVAYQAGELKHGTISLIEKDTPVIAIATDEVLREKMISNIKEVKSRGAYVIYVTNEVPEEDFYDDLILVDKIHPILQSITAIIPLQLLAYHVAKNNGCDIDKPRNLAKSVTVE